MKSRNAEVLASFVKYCESAPELRFWQALLNWSGLGFILHSDAPPYLVNTVIQQSVVPTKIMIEDTYHWEGRNG